jgi:excisionase family DNA binding protein
LKKAFELEEDMQMEKQYYKTEEVMEILKKSRTTFYREVEDGTIPSEFEEGKKRGRKFPKEAIDAYAKILKSKDGTRLTFGPITNSELWANYQNHIRLYDPEDIVTYDRLLEWKEANQNIFMSAREDGKRVGGVTIMPLAEDVIKSLIDAKIRERDIQLRAIGSWSDKNLTAYIPSMSIHHTGDEQIDRKRGYFIVGCTIRWMLALDRQHDIKKWYAIAVTPEGKKLAEYLGLDKIEGKREAYVLTDIKKISRPHVQAPPRA